MRLLSRYVLLELLGPFVFSVGIFVALFLGADVLASLMRLSAQYQVSPLHAASLVLYRLPWILSFAFPLSMLLGALLCFGRLSSDSEVAAMLAGGTSFPRLALPVLVAGMVMSGVTWLFQDTLTPAGESATADLLNFVKGGAAGARQNVALVERRPGDIQLRISAEEFHWGRGELKNVVVDFCRHWEPQAQVIETRAVWQEDEWRLYNGRVLVGLHQRNGPDPPVSGGKAQVWLGSQKVELDKSPEQIAREMAKPRELNAAQLRQRITDKKSWGADWRREIVPDLVALHKKYSLPCTCFFFALIGTPLGLRPARSSKGVAYGICLAIIFAHYVLWHTCELMGHSGALAPVWAAWLPNLILALVGGLLLRAKSR